MTATVAAIRTAPERVLEDHERLFELANARAHLDPAAPTILKDNISWHFPFPAANTTPWQLEGTIRALRSRGYADQTCVQNKTVVTDALKGEDLNGYLPIFREYGIPVLYNFKDEDMRWVQYRPRATMRVLDRIYPEGIHVPDFFFGKNIVHLPTVKCVAGDTEVVLADGSVIQIRDLVRRQMAAASHVELHRDGDTRAEGSVELLAMGEDGRIRPYAARWFWRTASRGRRVLRLRTRTGRMLTATADHPIRTPNGWTALGDLTTGARLAIARRLGVDGARQALPVKARAETVSPVVARAGRKYSATFCQDVVDSYRSGVTATAVAEHVGVPWQSVVAILKRNDVPIRGCAVTPSFPEQTSPELWRWLGYVMAEGCIERGSTTDKLWWVNSEPAIRDDFVSLTSALFGVEAKLHRNGKQVYLYGKWLGRLFDALGLPVPLNAGNKRVPALLFRCTDEEIAAFLSAYLDGDGSVSARQAELFAVTKSEQLAHDLQLLFSRLGVAAFRSPIQRTILGRWAEPRTYHQVTVSGEGLAHLATRVRFRHPNKQARFIRQSERFLAGKRPSNWDVVPLPTTTFRAVRTGLGLTQAATGKPWSVNSIEHGHVRPTPPIARYFVNLFDQHDADRRFAEPLSELRRLISDDLAWDVVESVEDVAGDGVELFDLTVPEAGSFVANGLIVHNCHIYTTTTGAMKNAFGGLLNTRRHYTHSWIHETLVDLLAIQKEIHAGLFAVMDGTTAGNGPGPRTMYPQIKNVILASGDQVAIDAVAAKLMGFDPLSIPYIRMAHDAGLGVGDPREIELVGDADLGNESWGFSVGDNGVSRVGDLVWFGSLKPIQNVFMRTPLVNLFILGSEAYHDYYRWPVRDRRVFEAWQERTPWGRLFAEYRRLGVPERPTSAAS